MFIKQTSVTYTDNSRPNEANVFYNKETVEKPVSPKPDHSVWIAGVIFTVCCLAIINACGNALSRLPTPVFREQPNHPVERLNSY